MSGQPKIKPKITNLDYLPNLYGHLTIFIEGTIHSPFFKANQLLKQVFKATKNVFGLVYTKSEKNKLKDKNHPLTFWTKKKKEKNTLVMYGIRSNIIRQ